MPQPSPVTDPTLDEREAPDTVSVRDEGVDVDEASGDIGSDDTGVDDDGLAGGIDGSGDDTRRRGRAVRSDGSGSSTAQRAPIGILTIVLGVLAVLGLAGTLFFGFAWNSERSSDNAEASMETTAGDFLVALFDFDGRTIDEDFDNIMSYATGEFADQAESEFADDDTRAALREVQASSRVEVRDLNVSSFEGDRGRVFAVVDQTIANNQIPNPQSDQVRLEITLRKVDGDWKVSALDVLEAPASQAAIAGGTVPTGSTGTTAPAIDPNGGNG